jgi:hypothetical protein
MKKQKALFILIVAAAITLTAGFILSYALATRVEPAPPLPTPAQTATPESTVLQTETVTAPTSTPVAASATAVKTWNGLLISVDDVEPNAWPLIKAHNQFNEPPLDGKRMLLITIQVTGSESSGEERVKVYESDFRLIGERGQIYNTYSDETSCGVVPDELDGVVTSNHWIRGAICVQTPKTERGFQLIYEPSFNSPTVYIPVPKITD